MDDAANELCARCGAPRAAGFAECKYCKTPYKGKTVQNAVPCPSCTTLNELGMQHCVKCQAWLVVQCVFCGFLSPHNVPACQKCREAFAGAPERFKQRQQQANLQQGLQVAGTVGTVAASFLGGVAGSMAGSSHHGYGEHHHHHHHQEPSSGPGFFDQVFSSNEPPPPPPPEPSGGGFFDTILHSNDQMAGQSSGQGFFDTLLHSNDDAAGTTPSASGDSGGVFDSLFSGSSDSSSDDDGDDD